MTLEDVFRTCPSEIIIYGVPFKIVFVDAFEPLDSDRILWGRIVRPDGIIEISKRNWHPRIIIMSLLHEITHGLVFLCPKHLTAIKTEEQLCEAMECLLPELIRDNPRFFAWASKVQREWQD